jgi:MFS family permease
MVLPLLGTFAVVVAVGLYNKIPNFFVELAILYGVSGGLLGVVLGLLSTNLLAVTVAGFGLVAMLMSAVNGVITSMIPLYMREKLGNSGMIAGVLTGFCYVGSTIASYGLGALAEGSGWTAVLTLFIVLCVFAVLVGVVGALLQRRIKDE